MTDPDRDALDVRPTADEMLARLRAETPSERGRLRVYLGMAPGVGKTYKMLEEGQRRVARGTDLVVGFVETHGRQVVAELLTGLEIVPRRRIEYRGVVIEEMDTDAVLARKPTVALVDELAHTNVPGSPREKRWQDVEVLRDAGIHVVSTMNIQHLESVADAVATITGAPVRERLPDEVLAGADEVELVDMSPHALRQRFRHGNVYPPDRAQVALERFFTEPNLTALRELVLRYVARRVEEQLEGLAVGRERNPVASVSERVLVLVDASPASRRAIHRAVDLAATLHAQLVAVVPEAAEGADGGWEHARNLRENTDYAIDLGAEVVRIAAGDLADELVAVARRYGSTHLVLPHRRRSRLERLRPSLVDRLTELDPEVELYLIPARPGP